MKPYQVLITNNSTFDYYLVQAMSPVEAEKVAWERIENRYEHFSWDINAFKQHVYTVVYSYSQDERCPTCDKVGLQVVKTGAYHPHFKYIPNTAIYHCIFCGGFCLGSGEWNG